MKIVIVSPVEHDGKALAAGDNVDMDKAVALSLIASGAAKDPRAKEPEGAVEPPEAGA